MLAVYREQQPLAVAEEKNWRALGSRNNPLCCCSRTLECIGLGPRAGDSCLQTLREIHINKMNLMEMGNDQKQQRKRLERDGSSVSVGQGQG